MKKFLSAFLVCLMISAVCPTLACTPDIDDAREIVVEEEGEVLSGGVARRFLGEYCNGGSECFCIDYYDLSPMAWYHESVDFILSTGYMSGYSSGFFSPYGRVTRAQLISILYRMAGSPATDGVYSFDDVPSGAWYAKAVRWAYANGLVYGYGGSTLFGPNESVTRQEAITILYGFAQMYGHNTSTLGNTGPFLDSAAISSEAGTPMAWAVGEGIITGDSNNMLRPYDNLTRAQLATILYRYFS